PPPRSLPRSSSPSSSSSFFSLTPPPPPSTLFPYTTLFRSRPFRRPRHGPAPGVSRAEQARAEDLAVAVLEILALDRPRLRHAHPDRKSTRLNSSHGSISYAVFCLKKKKHVDRNTS